MKKLKWKVYKIYEENTVSRWIVTDRVWKGTVKGYFNTQEDAESFAGWCNEKGI